MNKILCYGDSNVWGFVPGSFNIQTELAEKHHKNLLWASILQKKLGDKYDILSDGINGRTTDLDEINPGRPFRNGLAYLGSSLEIHYPINLVIFWLGTNDTKKQFSRSSLEIKEAMRKLIIFVNESIKGQNAHSPNVLLICPPPIIENLNPEFDYDAIRKSKELSKLYFDLAIEINCDFLDAGLYVQSSFKDGLHLDAYACNTIGVKIAEKIKLINI